MKSKQACGCGVNGEVGLVLKRGVKGASRAEMGLMGAGLRGGGKVRWL